MPGAIWTDHWIHGQSPYQYREQVLIVDTPSSSMLEHISSAPVDVSHTPTAANNNEIYTYLTIVSSQATIVCFNKIMSLYLYWISVTIPQVLNTCLPQVLGQQSLPSSREKSVKHLTDKATLLLTCWPHPIKWSGVGVATFQPSGSKHSPDDHCKDTTRMSLSID